MKNRIKVCTKMKHVKVAVALIALAFVLGGCSGDLSGKWTAETEGCPRSLEFLGDNTMVMVPAMDNTPVTGTIQNLEGDKYKYDAGVVSVLVELKAEEDSLQATIDGNQCQYKKAE